MTGTSRAAALPDVTVPLDLSIAVVPFAVGHERLDVALLKDADDRVLLPTGSSEPGRSLAEDAARIANLALRIAPDYLRQLYTFSIPRPRVAPIVAYFTSLSDETRGRLTLHGIGVLHDAEHLPELAAPDRGIIERARTWLHAGLDYSDVGCHLVPRKITLSDRQEVNESCIEHQLDKHNVRRRVLSSGLPEALGWTGASDHRPATIYRFAGGDPPAGKATPNESDWSA